MSSLHEVKNENTGVHIKQEEEGAGFSESQNISKNSTGSLESLASDSNSLKSSVKAEPVVETNIDQSSTTLKAEGVGK